MNKSNRKLYTDPASPPPVGAKIYVGSSFSISHGSDDFAGGLATVSGVEDGISGGESTPFIRIAECPSKSYNWRVLAGDQEKLAKQYKGQKAHADPDIDTPWIQKGDTVDGKVYDGPDIW